MKPKLIAMVGLQGSGKSYKSSEIKRELEEQYSDMDTVILSSDHIRFEHPEIANDNSKVFNKLYADMNYFLRHNCNVIIDATNITIKSRKQIFLNLHEDCEKICHIMNTPYYTCKMRIFNRNQEGYCDHYVPQEALDRYLQSFEIPFYEEGWDKIILEYEISNKESNETLKAYITQAQGFDQKNKHHTQDLGKHMQFVGDTLKEITDNQILVEAGYLHDVGKLFTQTVGEDGNCHYYNHENVGAYNLMCGAAIYVDRRYELNDTLKWLFYINYHMRLHQVETEKSIKKWKSIFGEELYNDLRLFEKADKTRPKLED